jgi:hypothetical protein
MKQLLRRRVPGPVRLSLLLATVVWFCPTPESLGDEYVGLRALQAPQYAATSRAKVTPAALGINPANRTERVIRLPAVSAVELQSAAAKGMQGLGGRPLPQIGVCRNLSADAMADVMASGEWFSDLAGQWEWRVKICSPDAVAVRLRIENCDLPGDAALFVQGASDVAGPFFARGPHKTGAFWTPAVMGETAELVYRHRPGDVPPVALPFEVVEVAHIYEQLGPVEAKVGGCQQDWSCWPEWHDVGLGVGMMEFVSGSSVYLCSGVLLNNAREDFSPYFLTAHHCISTEQEAASAQIFWLYQTDTCNGSPPLRSEVPSTTGATLLATAPYWEFSDVSLLRLTGQVPDGLTYVGWTTEPVAPDDPVVGIHHPEGTFKRVCFGHLFAEGNPDRTRAPVYWVVLWDQGTTEPGSSGSPLFNAERQVIGQLYGGGASCTQMDQPDYYGKFGASYPFLAPYLDPDSAPGLDDEFEQNDTAGEAAVIGAGTYGDLMLLDDDWYQFKVFAYQTAQVQIIFDHLVADLDLTVYDEQLIPLATSSSTENDSENVRLTAGAAGGTYLIRVYGLAGAEAPYALTVHVGNGHAPPGADDGYEENDSAFDAASMAPGVYEGLVAMDEDWYRLDVDPGWTLTVRIDFLHATGDLDLVLYDASFNELSRSDGVGNSEQVASTNQAKSTETFFIKVYGYGQDTNDYTMAVAAAAWGSLTCRSSGVSVWPGWSLRRGAAEPPADLPALLPVAITPVERTRSCNHTR